MEVYQYEPIIQDEHGFRIVRLLPGSGPYIHVEIIHASFDESDLMEYDAVSYVWGSPELTSSIIVGGKRLNVTQNLEFVLRDLRLSEDDRYLWIDGICINQEKDKERNHQVRQMGTIYQRAELVLFHIGRSNDLTLVVQGYFEIYQEQHKLRPEMAFESVWFFVVQLLTLKTRHFEAEIRLALRTILEAPWFRRIWIVQEVANARRALLHWGSASLPVALFVQLVWHLGIQIDHQQSAILDMMPQRRRAKSQWSSQQDLYDLLKNFRGAEASHDHDRIFALVGMCADGKGHGTLTADYSKDLDLVIREAIAYMGFCNTDDIDVGFRSTSQFFNDIDNLFEHLLVHLAENERLASLESLLLNRGDQLSLTDKILDKVIARDNPEVIRLLFQYSPYSEKSLPFMIAQFKESVALAQFEESVTPAQFEETVAPAQFEESMAPAQFEEFVAPAREFTSLWQAILRRDLDLIKDLLVDGADANAIAPTGLSPIGWAAMEGDEDLVKILLDFHADVEAGFYTPLFLAAKHGKLKIVKLLLVHGVDIDSRNDRGRTPLSIAASAGNEAILSGGQSKAGINVIDDFIDQTNRHLSPADLSREHFMTSMRKEYWPNHRLRLEPSTWCPTVSSKKGADSYQGDESYSQLDLESSDHSHVYSEIVDLLLQQGAHANSRDKFSLTPLWWSVNWGNLPLVTRFLQVPKIVADGGALHITPLSWAIWNGHRNVVEMLLDGLASVKKIIEFGVPSPYKSPFKVSPLFWAICTGNKSQLLQLLSHGMRISGDAAVELAISGDHLAIVQLLLDRNPVLATQGAIPALFQAMLASEERVIDAMLGNGVDTEIFDNNNWTPLTLAAEKGWITVVQQLLDRDVNPNVMDGEGRTALMIAVSRGFADILKVLIENGANVHAKIHGWTALQRAACDGHDEIVKLLLEQGAYIEADDNIRTPLLLASLEGHSAIVGLLLEHDANVHARNGYGETALLLAVKPNRGDVEKKLAVARLLLKHGANIDAQNDFGYTPIILASRAGYTDLVKLLLLENANVNIRDSFRYSALDWSVNRKHSEIELMLREKRGARVHEVPDNILEMSD